MLLRHKRTWRVRVAEPHSSRCLQKVIVWSVGGRLGHDAECHQVMPLTPLTPTDTSADICLNACASELLNPGLEHTRATQFMHTADACTSERRSDPQLIGA